MAQPLCGKIAQSVGVWVFVSDFNKEDVMQIQVLMRVVFGYETIYPVCEKAKLFAKIAGKKTLGPTVLSSIKALGYEIEVIPSKLEIL